MAEGEILVELQAVGRTRSLGNVRHWWLKRLSA
jgi:hypothetical protein